MSTKTKTTPYTVRLDESVRKKLEVQAALEDRPAAQLAARAIEAMLRSKQVKREAIEAAVAEADKGIFVSMEATSAWVESWGAGNELPVPKPDINLRSS